MKPRKPVTIPVCKSSNCLWDFRYDANGQDFRVDSNRIAMSLKISSISLLAVRGPRQFFGRNLRNQAQGAFYESVAVQVGIARGRRSPCCPLVSFTPGQARADGTPFKVDSFSRIQIEGGGHAIITIGEPASVGVTGSQKVVDQLQVQVWFGTLEIETEDDVNSTKSDLVYHITVPSLTQIELEGSVSAELDGLTVDSLEIQVEDSATLQLTKLAVSRLQVQVENNASVTIGAAADQQDIEIQESGTYDALELEGRSAEIQGVCTRLLHNYQDLCHDRFDLVGTHVH
jgi:Putative auto-transporter adhesin, head GIN domain